MTVGDILWQRLYHHQLTQPKFSQPGEWVA